MEDGGRAYSDKNFLWNLIGGRSDSKSEREVYVHVKSYKFKQHGTFSLSGHTLG